MQDKKGFTLVELLAVIVILAVVMVIAVTAVGPLMAKSRKGALGSEGLGLVEAAKLAYQAEQMAAGTDRIKPTQSVCFELQWLVTNGYFESKKSLSGYTGSVLVTYNTGATGKNGTYSYKFWISDGNYSFGGTDGQDVDTYAYDLAADSNSASATCGSFSGTVKK